MKMLDGELHILMHRLGPLQKLAKHNSIFTREVCDGLDETINFLIKLIKTSRSEGLNWILTEGDIFQCDDLPNVWRLPGIELWFCLPDGNTHNDIPKLWKAQKLDEVGVQWDTESGCLYPMFSSEYGAKAFVKNLNVFIDKLLEINE
jgi:hypothetical protein